MAATSRRSSSGCGPVLRSAPPPAGRFQSTRYSSSSAFASSTSSFTSRSSTFFNRTVSPPRLNVATASPSAQSVRFSFDRPTSPSRSISVSPRGTGSHHHHHTAVPSGRNISQPKRTCMCSPTTHPGSFRCSLHKNNSHVTASAPYSQNRLNARRSAMTNSLVRIGGVEGDLVRRALAALIRPSSHSQRRRADFCPRPSRLSAMSKSD
ncbi:hypothetical protein ACFX13_017825 [Malus domestica]|uniref:uncharacterized protein LOC126602410 n=1 Tax=Malus sylvestris TaxID=3752 RepID=UPI0010AB4369|nr:uncharacterized protein LOC103400049 [Malus domestica]XP_050125218.1 uncharacterized protein LOC126602410 [Malus sylvestris]